MIDSEEESFLPSERKRKRVANDEPCIDETFPAKRSRPVYCCGVPSCPRDLYFPNRTDVAITKVVGFGPNRFQKTGPKTIACGCGEYRGKAQHLLEEKGCTFTIKGKATMMTMPVTQPGQETTRNNNHLKEVSRLCFIACEFGTDSLYSYIAKDVKTIDCMQEHTAAFWAAKESQAQGRSRHFQDSKVPLCYLRYRVQLKYYCCFCRIEKGPASC
jgi:hypothetical protein